MPDPDFILSKLRKIPLFQLKSDKLHKSAMVGYSPA